MPENGAVRTETKVGRLGMKKTVSAPPGLEATEWQILETGRTNSALLIP